jgi:hypothetical protein
MFINNRIIIFIYEIIFSKIRKSTKSSLTHKIIINLLIFLKSLDIKICHYILETVLILRILYKTSLHELNNLIKKPLIRHFFLFKFFKN